MGSPSVVHTTFVVERSYPATPERVFAAFADPAKKRRWFVESEHTTLEEFAADFRVGGHERTRSRFGANAPAPVRGAELINETWYQDIVPDRRLVMASTMTLGERRISASQSTVELLPSSEGTDLVFTEQAAFFEGADGPELREAGWRALLEHLASEVSR
jgi:uncharacterized protein YndB with AHSA1/START domain